MYLNGERMISLVRVRIPKHEAPILAEAKKKIVTINIDRRANTQVSGVKIFSRFHIGEVLGGN